MPDELDQIQERMERDEELRKKYTPKPIAIKSTGKCLYCDVPLDDDRRWCDKDCMIDYQYYIANRNK